MQWEEGTPANISMLMHSYISASIQVAKVLEPQKLAIFTEKRIAEHGEIVGHLLHTTLIRFCELWCDLTDLCGEGLGRYPACSLEEINCHTRWLGRSSHGLPHDARKNVRGMAQTTL